MITISLCMIVKNEEDVIGRCLESARSLVDEIIIADTGSTDRTKEICAQYTHKIYDFPWIEDFAAARNFAFSKGTMQYLLWLDADDVILPEDMEQFIQLKHTLSPEIDIVMAKYNTAFDENGKPSFSYSRERIIKNTGTPLWTGAVHEVIPPFGKVLHTEAAVTHRKLHPSPVDRNLKIFERMLEKGETLDPRQEFYYARELYYNQRYEDAVQWLEKFLWRPEGWIENKIDACRHLAYCRYALKQDNQALSALLQSLHFDTPRAEVCCEIGRHFFDRGQYTLAIFWYELALTRERKDQSGAFISPDCYDFIPCLQLCVCYYRLGDMSRAKAYNEQAGRIKPDSQAYLANREIFKNV